MIRAIGAIQRAGLPDPYALQPASSEKRFPDGAHFRIEIPSVEGPRVLEAVIDAAQRYGVDINRVSQGSGAMILTDADLSEMAAMGAAAGLEVSLFVGPREGFGVGAHARSPDGGAQFGQIRGMRQLVYAIEDVVRAAEAGIRSFLIADLGLLTMLCEMQSAGELPLDCGWKISVAMAPSNPASLLLLERAGATSANIPSDVSIAELAEMRSVTALPIDLYLESPDSLGGVVRGNEIAELVGVGAPLHAKFGLRNSRPLYPSGEHLEAEACMIARAKVARAAAALEWLHRFDADVVQSAPHAKGVRVPRTAGAAAEPVAVPRTSAP
ncbi:MAG: U32 family peptidase [Thermoleophilia bacterium]|nr:U32 family peptidase [Thermoleophilia bacterium]